MCEYISDNKQDLDKHVAEHRPTEKILESEVAPELEETEEACAQEINDQLKYNCGKCEFSSEDKDKLNEHIDNLHKPTDNFNCEKCEN